MHGRAVVVAALTSLVVAACSGGAATPAQAPSDSPATEVSAAPAASPTAPARSMTSDGDGVDRAEPSATTSAEPATSWGPTVRQWRRAGRLVADMSVKQMAGQVVVATYRGIEPPTDLVRDLHLGGVILMGDNVPSGADAVPVLRDVTRRLQKAAARPYPLVVAVDQEGGPVARVGFPATEFPPGMAHGAADNVRTSRRVAAASGTELAALGFTMVYAPVADVTSVSDPTIGIRSPGDRPALVGRIAVAQARGFTRAGVVPVLKHFPGHGSVPADSHVELPVQEASVERLVERDLRPFARAVRAGVPAVMVAHIDVRALDPGAPASLSRDVVTGVLRNRLGFEGVVVTDSLGMAAVADRYSSGESAVAALLAGADMVLMPPDARAARDGIVQAVRSGVLDRSRLVQAARRVVAMSLYQQSLADVPAPSVVGAHTSLSRELSAGAVTVVEGPCVGPYVGSSIRITGGTETDRQRMEAAARAAGLGTGAGDLVTLVSGPASSGVGDVVVALDTPYGLGGSSAATASLAVFGRTPQTFEALVDVLLGRSAPAGTLPVRVGALERPASC